MKLAEVWGALVLVQLAVTGILMQENIIVNNYLDGMRCI